MEIRERLKKGICSNCKLREMNICGACQIDFGKGIDRILSEIRLAVEELNNPYSLETAASGIGFEGGRQAVLKLLGGKLTSQDALTKNSKG